MPPMSRRSLSLALECRYHLRWASPQSGALEWERRSGASWLLDSEPARDYLTLTPETDQGDRRAAGPRFPSFVNRSRLAEPGAADITSERLDILEHPPQRQVRRKTGAPPPVRGSRLYFDWIVPGFTAVCFWAARWRWITALEGPVWTGLAPACTRARLSPNRCLAGLPSPSCPTEN